MRAMRRRVREHDVARWAASFLATLNGTAQPGGHSVRVLGKEGLLALMSPRDSLNRLVSSGFWKRGACRRHGLA